MRKNNIPVKEELIWGYTDIDKNLEEYPPPYVAFIPNDSTTLEIMEKMKRRGIMIPEDVGVIGFYDREVSHYSTPKLTTIGFDKEYMGRCVIDTLLKLIEGKPVDKKNYIPVHLIIRDSVKKQ